MELDKELLRGLRRRSFLPGQISGHDTTRIGKCSGVVGLEIFVGGVKNDVVGSREGLVVVVNAIFGVERARDSLRLGLLHRR